MYNQQQSMAALRMIETCASHSELYSIWDGTINHQSSAFYTYVYRQVKKYEPELLTIGIQPIAKAVVESWSCPEIW
jgi:hypothetical protein